MSDGNSAGNAWEYKNQILRRLLDEAPGHRVEIPKVLEATGLTESALYSLMTYMRRYAEPGKRFSAIRKGGWILYGEPTRNPTFPKRKTKDPNDEHDHLGLRFSVIRGICSRQPGLLPGIIAKIDQMILESLV